MKIFETRPREIGFVLWDHCQNLLDDPRICVINEPRHEKTNVLGSDLIRHKPGCTATEDN